jgi:hypothetical protein
MGEVIGLVAVSLIFGIPIVKIWTDHQRKVLEMKLRLHNQGDSGVRAELEALRQELHSLRDTSTQYDLSFDTALQRMEHRVEAIERRGQVAQSETMMQIGNPR